MGFNIGDDELLKVETEGTYEKKKKTGKKRLTHQIDDLVDTFKTIHSNKDKRELDENEALYNQVSLPIDLSQQTMEMDLNQRYKHILSFKQFVGFKKITHI